MFLQAKLESDCVREGGVRRVRYKYPEQISHDRQHVQHKSISQITMNHIALSEILNSMRYASRIRFRSDQITAEFTADRPFSD